MNRVQTQTQIGALIAYALPLKPRTPRFALLAMCGRFVEAQAALEQAWRAGR